LKKSKLKKSFGGQKENGIKLVSLFQKIIHESIKIYYHRIKRILSFLKKVLKLCENKPKVVADGGSRYPPGSEKNGIGVQA